MPRKSRKCPIKCLKWRSKRANQDIPKQQQKEEGFEGGAEAEKQNSDDVKLDGKYEWGKLWEKAYEILRDKDKGLMEKYTTGLLESDNGSRQKGPEGVEAESQGVNRERQLQGLIDRNLKKIENIKQFRVKFGDREIVIRDEIRRVVHAIVTAKDVISAAVSNEPHASLAWAGVLLGLNVFLKPIQQDEEAASGLEFIANLLVRYRLIERSHIQENSGNNRSGNDDDGSSLRKQVLSVYVQVLQYQIGFSKHYSHSTAGRYFRELFPVTNWKSMREDMEKKDKAIREFIETETNATIMDINSQIKRFHKETVELLEARNDRVEYMIKFQLLNQLNPLSDAAFDSNAQSDDKCLEGTQVDMLQRIQNWVDASEEPPIFWLHGMAGTGKSTIARTVANRLHDNKRIDNHEELSSNILLGGTFFFRRNAKTDYASVFFRTLARQLANTIPDIAEEICHAVEKDYDIASKQMAVQWHNLIYKPLQKIGKRLLPQLTLVLVIDALDECQSENPDGSQSLEQGRSKSENDIQIIVELLSQIQELEDLHIRVRIFITSRPTDEIELNFENLPKSSHNNEALLKIPLPQKNSSRDDDITLFIQHQLPRIRKRHKVAGNWPGEDMIRELVEKCDGLFIYAATTCRFLDSDIEGLDDHLKMIFNNMTDERFPQKHLDDLYIGILNSEIARNPTKHTQVTRRESFKRIVGSVIILSDTVSISVLSELVLIHLDEIQRMLDRLHSVLTVSRTEDSIELLHLSFRDFLVDQNRCGQDFWIDKNQTHCVLFNRCVDIMSEILKRDVCHLGDVSTRVHSVEPDWRDKCLPRHVKYACCYWIDHLKQSGIQNFDNGEFCAFFKDHFTHWVEAMSLLEDMPRGILMLNDLFTHLTTLPKSGNEEFSDFVDDAKRFMLNFRSVIEQAPLQLYTSALLFAPSESVIRKQFEKEIPSWINKRTEFSKGWDPLLQSLDHEYVYDMSLSADDELLASAEWDKIQIWNTSTWRCVQELDCDEVQSISFSPDSKLLAVSSRKDVRIWRLATGTSKVIHNAASSKVQFSPEGQILASVHHDGEVHLWNIDTEELLCKFDANGDHRRPIMNIVLSRDNRLILLDWGCFLDYPGDDIDIWDAIEGNLLHRFQSRATGSVSFSSDQKTVMCVTKNGEVQYWESETKIFTTVMQIGRTIAATFSPDEGLLASFSADGRILIWELSNGSLLRSVDLMEHPKDDDLRFAWIKWLPGERKTVAVETESFICTYDTIRDTTPKMLQGALFRKYSSHNDLGVCVPHSTQFSAKGNMIADRQQVVQVWDCFVGSSEDTGQSLFNIRRYDMSPDGTAAILSQHELAPGSTYSKSMLFNTDSGSVTQLPGSFDEFSSFSADSTKTVSKSGLSVTLWDTGTWQPLKTFTPTISTPSHFKNAITDVSVGANLAAYSFESEEYNEENTRSHHIALWNLDSEKIVKTISISKKPRHLKISRDGSLLGEVVDNDHTDSCSSVCRIWNIEKGDWELQVDLNERVDDLDISPDNRYIATSNSSMGRSSIYDMTNGNEVQVFDDMWPKNTSLAFSHDGKWITYSGKWHQLRSNLVPTSVHREGISIAGDWIMHGKKEIIMIPPSCRPNCGLGPDPSVTKEQFITMVYQSRLPVTIGFDTTGGWTLESYK